MKGIGEWRRGLDFASSAGSSCWETPQYVPPPQLRLGMEDPTWFWGGVQPWKPTPRHISSKRFNPKVKHQDWKRIRCGPLGHKYVQPTWETTYGKTYRKPTTTSTTQYFTKSTRSIFQIPNDRTCGSDPYSSTNLAFIYMNIMHICSIFTLPIEGMYWVLHTSQTQS
jgi:hypothetical protein